jgi:ribose transport system permease protein
MLEDAASPSARRRASTPLWGSIARAPGVAYALILLMAIYSVAAPGFASIGNLANVLSQSVILLIVALPMTLIIMTEGMDLSAGAVLSLASVVLTMVALQAQSVALGVLAGLVVGAAFGALNGLLVAYLQIQPFVATLGTLGAAQGLALVLTDGQSVDGIPPAIASVYSARLAGVPAPIVIGALVYALFHVLLYHTRLGTYVPALGGNPQALELAGVPRRGMLVVVYAIGGCAAALAGLMMAARMNAGHPTAGIGTEFDAIAAVAVGGTSFEKGDGWLLGTLLGVLAVGILRNGLNIMAIPSSAQVAGVGVLTIATIFLDARRRKRS